MGIDLKRSIEKLINEDVIIGDYLFICYRGSVSHDLVDEETSDVDLISIYLAPRNHYVGFPGKKHNKGRDRSRGEYDVVNYELRYWLSLAKSINPNVLTPLFCSEANFLTGEPLIAELRENKQWFLNSKLIYDSFGGYARGQFDKLKGDKDNLSEIKELRELDEAENLNGEEQKRYNELKNKYFQGWMGRKRKEKIVKFGYDPKWAKHCVRLLRCGKELLQTRDYHVSRKGIDREELMKLGSGEYSRKEIIDLIENEFDEYEEVWENHDENWSTNEERIEKWLMRFVEFFHFGL